MRSAGTQARSSTRAGVALLTVLMTLALIAAIAVTGRVQTSAGLRALERDMALTQARWRAAGCTQQSIAELDEAIGARQDTAWSDLDHFASVGQAHPQETGCQVVLAPLGMQRFVNSVNLPELIVLLRAAGVAAVRADSLAEALLDWRDADSNPRDTGAEYSWYRAHYRPPPRNAALRNMSELRLIRGYESVAFRRDTIEHLLSVDSVRVSLRHASLPVLLSMNFLSEPLARELDRSRFVRAFDGTFQSLPAVTGALSLSATVSPDQWLLTVRAGEHGIDGFAEIRTTLGRGSDRVGVLAVEEDR